MKVLFVVNNAFVTGNGLSASARRTASELKKRGYEVNFLTLKEDDCETEIPAFALPSLKLPVFENLVESQGYQFAQSDYNVIKEALEWADIVHIEEPFWLQVQTCKIANKMGKVCVGTYHLHPENLYSSIGLRKEKIINLETLYVWRKTVFNKCKIIQCPTQNVYDRLVKHHFKSELRVISNGMIPKTLSDDEIERIKAKLIKKDTFTIISTGRYSIEKDQITLLKALRHSRFAKRVKLILAGQGPNKNKLVDYAQKLYDEGVITIPVSFGFYDLRELEELYIQSDLYIHCATIEVEGLSCMEAIQMGLVPIIASGPLTATSQYAMSDMSKYQICDYMELAKKIDYWLEDDDRRRTEALKYMNLDNSKYSIENSIDQIEQMYKDALSK